jgi:hypothetical protein
MSSAHAGPPARRHGSGQPGRPASPTLERAPRRAAGYCGRAAGGGAHVPLAPPFNLPKNRRAPGTAAPCPLRPAPTAPLPRARPAWRAALGPGRGPACPDKTTQACLALPCLACAACLLAVCAPRVPPARLTSPAPGPTARGPPFRAARRRARPRGSERPLRPRPALALPQSSAIVRARAPASSRQSNPPIACPRSPPARGAGAPAPAAGPRAAAPRRRPAPPVKHVLPRVPAPCVNYISRGFSRPQGRGGRRPAAGARRYLERPAGTWRSRQQRAAAPLPRARRLAARHATAPPSPRPLHVCCHSRNP